MVRARGGSIGDVLDAARQRLRRLGPAEAFEAVLLNATDLAGGFLAWARAGLPYQPGAAPPAVGYAP